MGHGDILHHQRIKSLFLNIKIAFENTFKRDKKKIRKFSVSVKASFDNYFRQFQLRT